MPRSAQPGDDPYQVLGVGAGASREDIVRAYHRAAHDTHPDAYPADPQAAARFQALTDAYDVLSDAGRRARYDRRQASGQTAAQHPPSRSRPAAGDPPGRPGAPLWAGPVRIDPPAASGGAWDGPHLGWPDDWAELAPLLSWYLRRVRGWSQ